VAVCFSVDYLSRKLWQWLSLRSVSWNVCSHVTPWRSSQQSPGSRTDFSVQVEGLRLWRVTAAYDLRIASLDALWPLLAAHFAGPPAAPHAGAADSAAAAAASGSDRHAAQLVLAREALLTAAALVSHAARC
jgi:hypothetical protein